MKRLRRILQVFLYQFRREFLNIRTVIIFLIIGIYVYICLEPVGRMIFDVGIKANPTGFVHIMNDFICQMVVTIGIVFLMSNLSVLNDSCKYIIYRSGEIEWEIGNILYIIIFTFLYSIFILLTSIVSLVGKTDFDMSNWGKIWGTLSRTNAYKVYGIKIEVSNYLVGKFEPTEAMIDTFFWYGYAFYGWG